MTAASPKGVPRSDSPTRNPEDPILRGFKTIRELDFRPGPLTVLIGPNGAGKSNFISFFRLLSWALSDRDNLQSYSLSELWEKNVIGGRP